MGGLRWLVIAILAVGCADVTDVAFDGGGETPTDGSVGRDRFVPPVPPDADIPVEGAGELLEPCDDGADCVSGYCLQVGSENLCTDFCGGGRVCPDGWSCKGITNVGADVTFICAPDSQTLCEPCSNNTDCGAFGDMCLSTPDGRVCGRDCAGDRICPDGYLCAQAEDLAGNAGWQCVPEHGHCSCDEDQAGQTRSCARQSAFGICEGLQICDPEVAWGGCSAHLPAEEICDGLDNDCDGAMDEDMLDRPCAGTPNPLGSCDGIERCDGARGWVCDAPAAQGEICDGLDNDCNGLVDDGLCFDGNPCTEDVCDAEAGCAYPVVAGACDDQDPCSLQDHCVDGACAGTPRDCDDGNPCTVNRCDPVAGGCVTENLDGAPCDLGNACTQDVCQQGACVQGAPVVCPIRDTCLRPSCDPVIGCVDEPLTGNACDDGDDCSVNDVCSNGDCIGGRSYCIDRPCVDLNCSGDVNFAFDGICLEAFGSALCVCVCF